MRVLWIAILLLAVWDDGVGSSSDTIQELGLVCQPTQVTNEIDGEVTYAPNSSPFTLLVSFSGKADDTFATISQSGYLNEAYMGHITDQQIYGESIEPIAGTNGPVTSTISIERYTGKFTLRMITENKSAAVNLIGDCKQADKKF